MLVTVCMCVVMGMCVRLIMVVVDMLMVVFMSVVPQLCLGQQEKEHHANQQRHEQIVRAGFAVEGLRQQVHERRGQQSAGSQTQQTLLRAVTLVFAKAHLQRQVSHPHASNPGSQGWPK